MKMMTLPLLLTGLLASPLLHAQGSANPCLPMEYEKLKELPTAEQVQRYCALKEAHASYETRAMRLFQASNIRDPELREVSDTVVLCRMEYERVQRFLDLKRATHDCPYDDKVAIHCGNKGATH